MFREIYDSGEYEKIIQRECRYAYRVYLMSEPVFIQDCKNLGLKKRALRRLIIKKLAGLKNALLDTDSIFEDFFHKFDKDKDIEAELSSFVYDLYNILVLAVYLTEKYSLTKKGQEKAKNRKQKMANDLARSILEGSTIGKYDGFKPYVGRGYWSQSREIEWGINLSNTKIQVDDFYYAQNTFLMHQLLMLVVLNKKSDILPNNSIENCDSDKLPIDLLNDKQQSSKLIYIVTHFDSIMLNLKNYREKPPRTKLANIFFRKDFIDNFNMHKLLRSYIPEEDLPDNIKPTVKNIAETIGRILDDRIQKYINKKKAWSHVVEFMRYFPETVANRKNTHIDFSDGELIYIFNNNKTYGVTAGEHFYDDDMLELQQKNQPPYNQVPENLSYTELRKKFKKPPKDNIHSLLGVSRKKKLDGVFYDFRNPSYIDSLLEKLDEPVKKNPTTTFRHAKNCFLHTYIFLPSK